MATNQKSNSENKESKSAVATRGSVAKKGVTPTKSTATKKSVAVKKETTAKKSTAAAKGSAVKKSAVEAKGSAVKKSAVEAKGTTVKKSAVEAKRTAVKKSAVETKRPAAKKSVAVATNTAAKKSAATVKNGAVSKESAVDAAPLKDMFSAEPLESQLKADNSAREALLAGMTVNAQESIQKYEKKSAGLGRKRLIRLCAMAATVVAVILIILFSARGCASSKARAAAKARENTLALAQDYIDKGLYDQALGLLNELIITNADDADAKTLLEKAAELKKVAEANAGGGNGGSYSVNIDTGDIANAMQSSIDSMRNQLAQANEQNAKTQQEMNDLLRKQQEQAENEKTAQQEQKALQEAAQKQREQDEADRKAKEAELAKQDAAFKKLMDNIDDLIKQGEGCLVIGDASGALKYFGKAKDMLPSGNSDRDRLYSAGKLSQMGLDLYSTADGMAEDAPNKDMLEDNAVTYANDAIVKNSHDGSSHYILGMRAFHKKTYDTAEKELKLAVQDDSDNFMYYYQLGRVQATVKKYSDARSSFSYSAKYNDKYAPAQYNLGVVQERLNRSTEALAAYRKAYAIDPNYEKAFLAAARILSRNGDYTGAVNAYKEAARVNPVNANTYKEEGSAFASLQNYKEAESCYRKAISLLKPGEEDPATYYNLSTVMYNQGKNEDAVTYAKKAYDTKSSATKEVKVNSIYNYALICDKTGDFDSAVRLYEEVLKEDPSNIKSKVNLAVISLAQGQPDTALSFLTSAYQQEPSNFEVNNNLGSAYLAKGDYTNAISSFQQALRIDAKNNAVRTNLAAAYASAKQYDNAETTYLDVIKYDKENWDAYIELAKVCLAKNDTDSAEKYLLYEQKNKPAYRAEEVKQLLDTAGSKGSVPEK